MDLKSGCLVLFLAVNMIFAEERLRAFPTFDFASTLDHVPHLRHSLQRASDSRVRGLYPVILIVYFCGIALYECHADFCSRESRRLLSNSRESPLQSTEGTCAWDVDSEECSLSISSMKNLLEESDTEFAKIVVERLTCAEKTSKKDCNKEKACLWDKFGDNCVYKDMRRGHEDSPCAIAAPRYFDLFEAAILCGRQNFAQTCEMDKHCQWSYSYDSCNPDVNFLLTGIENFDEKVDQVKQSTVRGACIEQESLLQFPNFTWQSVLDHEPSPVDCPSDIEPLVCKNVDAFYRSFIGPYIYCIEKYVDAASQCNADAMCRCFEFTSFCLPAPAIMNAATLAAFRVLTNSLPDGVDKTFFNSSFTCLCSTEKESCGENCIWNPLADQCYVRTSLIADLTAEATQDSTDGFCAYLNVDRSLECRVQFTKDECQQSEFCHWSSVFGCERKEEFYLSAAADRDPELKQKYASFKTRCSKYTTAEACQEPDDLSSSV